MFLLFNFFIHFPGGQLTQLARPYVRTPMPSYRPGWSLAARLWVTFRASTSTVRSSLNAALEASKAN